MRPAAKAAAAAAARVQAAAFATLASSGRGNDAVLVALLVDSTRLASREEQLAHLSSVLRREASAKLLDAFSSFLAADAAGDEAEAPPRKRARTAAPDSDDDAAAASEAPWLPRGGEELPFDPAAALSAELLLFEAWVALRPAELAAREGLVRRIAAAARAAGVQAECRLFGSLAAGLATFLSDTDVGLHGPGLAAGTHLRALARQLQRCGWAEEVEFRSRARVPVVALRDRLTGSCCDISVAGGEAQAGEATTAAVRAMAGEWPFLFRPLLTFLKLLLDEVGLNKPFTGGLGSFKLAALLAVFLEEAEASSRRTGVPLTPANCLSGFLRYVARRFDFDSVVTFASARADFSTVFNSSAVCAFCEDAARRLERAAAPGAEVAPPGTRADAPRPRRSQLARIISVGPLAAGRRRSAARARACAAAAPQPPAPAAARALPPAPPPPPVVRTMYVFDFDGTLVCAPGPSEGRVCLAAAGLASPAKGWWTDAASLRPPLPLRPGPAMPAYAAACAAASAPGSAALLVLLSGRRASLRADVEAALGACGAPHAPHSLRLAAEGGGADTLTSKLQALAGLLEEHGGKALQEVHLYEDREEHAEALRRFADAHGSAPGLRFLVHHVGGEQAQAEQAAPPPAGDESEEDGGGRGPLPRLSCSGGYARLLLRADARAVPAAWREARMARDGAEDGPLHHCTLLSRSETSAYVERLGLDSMRSLRRHLQASLEAHGGAGSLRLGQLGVAADRASGAAAAFLTASWPAGEALRAAADLPPAHFHVTLGFTGADVHGVAKDASTRLRGLGAHPSAAAARRAVLRRADSLLRGEAEEASLSSSSSSSSSDSESGSSLRTRSSRSRSRSSSRS